MDPVIAEFISALGQVPVVGIAFWFGWKIYQQDQQRIDYLISVIVSMCTDEDAQAVRQALK